MLKQEAGEWIFPCYLWTKANPGCWTRTGVNKITPYQQMKCFNKSATSWIFRKWRNCSHLFGLMWLFSFFILIDFFRWFLFFLFLFYLIIYYLIIGVLFRFYLIFLFFFLCPVSSFISCCFLYFLLLFNRLFNFHVVLICFVISWIMVIMFLTEFEK